MGDQPCDADASYTDDIYSRFVWAMGNADTATMQQCVSIDFRADFGKGELTFLEFVHELDRQRTTFPDLRQNVDTHTAYGYRNTLHYTSDMSVVFGGLLTIDGRDFLPTGQTLVIRMIDSVSFDANGQISSLVVQSNLRYVMEQIYPSM